MASKPFVAVSHVDNVPWYDAPVPKRWHWCREQTLSIYDTNITFRCPCGAVRNGVGGRWRGKNYRRKCYA